MNERSDLFRHVMGIEAVEHRETEPMSLDRLLGLLLRVYRKYNDFRVKRMELFDGLLKAKSLLPAIGAPVASIEKDDREASGHVLGNRHLTTANAGSGDRGKTLTIG